MVLAANGFWLWTIIILFVWIALAFSAESHAVPRLTYADQNEGDYRALQDAVASGRISAQLGI